MTIFFRFRGLLICHDHLRLAKYRPQEAVLLVLEAIANFTSSSIDNRPGLTRKFSIIEKRTV